MIASLSVGQDDLSDGFATRQAIAAPRGNRTEQLATRSASGRIFAKHDGVWTDAAHHDSLAVTTIAPYSPAWFALVKARPALAEALGLDADGTAVPILLNASYSWQLSDTLSFSLGAGAGVAWSEFDLDEIAGVDLDASVDGWDFSFQGFSSLNYSVNQTTELSLGYRYIQTETDADSIQGHNLEAGVIVRF